jgi:hypothetical protein
MLLCSVTGVMMTGRAGESGGERTGYPVARAAYPREV